MSQIQKAEQIHQFNLVQEIQFSSPVHKLYHLFTQELQIQIRL